MRIARRCLVARRLAAVSFLVLAAVAGATPADAAPPTELFFSEYVEGSSNNKALEIYNGTGAAINLATAGYNVQMFFNGSTAAGVTINLTGTVAAGDVYVVAQSSANATILAQADQTNGSGWYNGDDAVVLRKGTTVIDVVGQIGFDPGTEWGAGLTSTADNTLRRKPEVCAGDPNGADAFDPTPQWDGFATDRLDGLGSHVVTCGAPTDSAPAVTSTYPTDGATDVPPTASLTVTFSEPVNVSGTWFTLVCSVSGTMTASASGGPTTFTLDPTSDFVSGEACTLTIVAARVTDQDANDPPDSMAVDFVVGFAAVDVCTLPVTPVPVIQGSGSTTPIPGPVTTRGVVVGDYEGAAPALRGFYLQDPAGDGNPSTSDGIFVFNANNNSVALGDEVVVTGSASEFQGQTQVSASSVVKCGVGTVAPVDVTLPFASADAPEAYEGMLVRLPQTLTVTEHFQLGRFGQVVVSSGGRLRQPTDVYPPGPDAGGLQDANDLNRLIVDDGANGQNPDPIVFGRGGAPLSASNTLRGGDTATGVVGVLGYTWGGNSASPNAYRVRPVNALGGSVTFQPANPRPASAPARSGSLRVASLNLLNFFNTFSGCTNGEGGTPTACRGASGQAELDRQVPKTVSTLLGTRADLVGVTELENDGYGPQSAIQFLVDRLNAATAPGTWAFVDADAATGQPNALGTDAIKVGFLYQPARVIAVGQTAALNTDAFVNGGDGEPRNRPALAQAFEEAATGARFVAVVNHLKSKGSACDVGDAGDGQGNCNLVRAAAAQELAAWLAADPTGVGDPDVLVVGDLNSYTKEDPLAVLEAAGYANLVEQLGGGYSYVFDGQWGSIDHALASASLVSQVASAGDWYINADEPSALDYNTDFKSAGQVASLYAPDAFRSADHNPVLVDLSLTVEADATASVNAGGHLVLLSPAGAKAGDVGSLASFGLNAKYAARGTKLQGAANLVVRRTENGEPRVYRAKATALQALLADRSAGTATILAGARLEDVTDPSAPVLVDPSATLRVTMTDRGEPSALDTIGFTVRASGGTLWFSSRWDGLKTVEQELGGGNVQVR